MPAVQGMPEAMPTELCLLVGPSPAQGAVRICFTLPREEWVSVCVFDVEGRRVATLVSDLEAPGNHEVLWSGDVGGERHAGTYTCRVLVENRSLEGTIQLTE